MMSALKAEFKKILSVRSTYVLSLVALLFVGIATFYGTGFKRVLTDPFQNLVLAGSLTQVAMFTGVFAGIVGLLLLTHEYRYNTITYSLTASNSRSKVLAAKIIAVFGYGLVLALLLGIIGLILVKVGASASGHPLPHQDISYATYLLKVITYTESVALVGLLFAALIRNQVGAIVTLLVFPGVFEQLLGLILKRNTVYTPFTAIDQVIQPPVMHGVAATHTDTSALGSLSAPRGFLVFLAYFIVGWAIAWYLFLRRDATKLDS